MAKFQTKIPWEVAFCCHFLFGLLLLLNQDRSLHDFARGRRQHRGQTGFRVEDVVWLLHGRLGQHARRLGLENHVGARPQADDLATVLLLQDHLLEPGRQVGSLRGRLLLKPWRLLLLLSLRLLLLRLPWPWFFLLASNLEKNNCSLSISRTYTVDYLASFLSCAFQAKNGHFSSWK